MARTNLSEIQQYRFLFKLRNDPTDNTSGAYELTIPFFRDGTPEQFLRFRKNLNKVFVGQNVTDGPGMFTIGRRLMDGDALAEFENFVTREQLTQTVNNFNRAMEAVCKHVLFPRCCVSVDRHGTFSGRLPWLALAQSTPWALWQFTSPSVKCVCFSHAAAPLAIGSLGLPGQSAPWVRWHHGTIAFTPHCSKRCRSTAADSSCPGSRLVLRG